MGGCCGGGSDKPKPKNEDESIGETMSRNKGGIFTGIIVVVLVVGLFTMVI